MDLLNKVFWGKRRAMSIRFTSFAFALCLLALGRVSRPSPAATPTTSFGVTATVQAGCLVSVTASAYWTYPAPLTNAVSAVSVTCTNATPYIVDLRAGLASGATAPNRRMTGGPFSALPDYRPLSNFEGIVNWSQTIGIAAASAYSDTVTLTVTY